MGQNQHSIRWLPRLKSPRPSTSQLVRGATKNLVRNLTRNASRLVFTFSSCLILVSRHPTSDRIFSSQRLVIYCHCVFVSKRLVGDRIFQSQRCGTDWHLVLVSGCLMSRRDSSSHVSEWTGISFSSKFVTSAIGFSFLMSPNTISFHYNLTGFHKIRIFPSHVSAKRLLIILAPSPHK